MYNTKYSIVLINMGCIVIELYLDEDNINEQIMLTQEH